MIILNFAHPLTEEQIAQLTELVGAPPADVITVSSQIDLQQPLPEQVSALVDSLGIDAERWQSESWLINPPSLNFSAVVLLAELHGRMGYFPPCMRLRPAVDSLTPRFEVAEVLNLNKVREQARTRRDG